MGQTGTGGRTIAISGGAQTTGTGGGPAPHAASGLYRRAAMLSVAALLAGWPGAFAAAQKAPGQPASPDRRTGPADGPGIAQRDERMPFDIPAQPLTRALTLFGQQSGRQVTFDAAIAEGLRSQTVAGAFTPEEALRRLLSGTGLTYRLGNDGTVTLGRRESGDVLTLDPVKVEGAGVGRFGDLPPGPDGFKADFQASATKSPLPLRETPQAVTVVTQESIEARQARDINTALELTAGVTTGMSSGGGPFAGPSPRVADQFSMRGQRLNGDRDVRIDGFASGGQRNDYDLAAFERIEVVKGPSSLMYGQGSLGGFINLVRKRPKDTAEASVTGQAGSFDTYRAEADVTSPFDDAKRLRGRLAVAYDDSGSFIDDVESRRYVLAPSLEARIGERTRALFEVLYQDTRSTPSLGVPLRRIGNEMTIPHIPRSFYFGVAPAEQSSTHEMLASMRLDHKVTDRWLATLLFQRTENDRRGIMDNYGYGFYAGGNTNVYASLVAHETDIWSGELRLDGAFDALGREHKLVTGIEVNKRSQQSDSGYIGLGTANIYADNFEAAGTTPGGDLPITFSNTTTDWNRAAYAQFAISVTDRTKLLAGGRYHESRLRSQDNIAGTADEATSYATTFRVGLTHDFTTNVTGYLSYAESFSPITSTSRSGAVLEPETGVGYEAGLKSEWFERRLGANIAVFQQNLDNRAISDPSNGPGESFNINGGMQRTYGLEIEVKGSPLPGLTIGAASTWLDSEYIDVRDANFGLTPPETADRQSSLYASYAFQKGELEGWGMGATLVSVGKRWAITGGENVFVDGYERVDLHGSYTGIKGLDLTLQIRNLFDSTYIERSNGAFGYGHYFGSPRAFLVRAKASF